MSGAELALGRRHCPARPDRVGYADADAETSAPDIPRLTKAFREAELMKAIAGVS